MFFVTRKDGVLDVWDYFFRQNEVAYSHKVCEEPLASIAISGGTKNTTTQLVAIGDDSGTVSLLELSDSLAVQQGNEKLAMAAMFDRETRREKNLVSLAREVAKRKKRAEAEAKDGKGEEKGEEADALAARLLSIDKQFVEVVKGADKDETKPEENGHADDAADDVK